MTAPWTRHLLAATVAVAVAGTTAACGTAENTPVGAPPPSATQPSSQPTDTPTGSTPTPPDPSAPTLPTADPTATGTPSQDCPDTVSSVRAAVQKAVWGKGAAKSAFQPVSVTICQYDAAAKGTAYASVMTKRTGAQAQALLDLVNSGKPAASKPRYCTADIGPIFVLRFTDNDRGVLTFAAEAFGCRRVVATSFEGQGKPGELPAPRQVSPALLKSLALR